MHIKWILSGLLEKFDQIEESAISSGLIVDAENQTRKMILQWSFWGFIFQLLHAYIKDESTWKVKEYHCSEMKYQAIKSISSMKGIFPELPLLIMAHAIGEHQSN